MVCLGGKSCKFPTLHEPPWSVKETPLLRAGVIPLISLRYVVSLASLAATISIILIKSIVSVISPNIPYIPSIPCMTYIVDLMSLVYLVSLDPIPNHPTCKVVNNIPQAQCSLHKTSETMCLGLTADIIKSSPSYNASPE